MDKKENLVKNLRRLLETEVSQAEVMMDAKGFAQELQEMIEKIGRLQNEDLPPVTDQMRETYGTQSASDFQTVIYGALQSVMDALYTAKGQVDDSVTRMAETGQFSAGIDMEKPVDTGDQMDLDNIGTEPAGEMPALPPPEGEEGEEEMDMGIEEPVGREKKKESIERLEQTILEMRKMVLRARKLKEAKGRR